MKHVFTCILLLLTCVGYAREWKSLRQYRNINGSDSIAQGHWLKKDRKRNTATWQAANQYNILTADGYAHYDNFSQKRDFYKWVDDYRYSKGHEVKWAGNAYIISKQLAYLDKWVVRVLVVNNKQFTRFVQESNALILKNIYPELKGLYKRAKPLTGESACEWDSVTIYKEQCLVLDTLYKKQPKSVMRKFGNMAAGKGLYGIAVKKKMRMKGDIRDCNNRCAYGLHTMAVYYDNKHCRK